MICKGIKNIENRTWRTNFRGRVYIHASAKYANDHRNMTQLFNPKQWKEIEQRGLEASICGSSFQLSAIIGHVDIVDCVINHSSIWAEKTEGIIDRNTKEFIAIRDNKIIYNWVLANPVLFDKPILNVKGKLSFWDCSTYLEGQ